MGVLVRFPLDRARALPTDYPRGPATILVLPSISFDDAIDVVSRLMDQGHIESSMAALGTSLNTLAIRDGR